MIVMMMAVALLVAPATATQPWDGTGVENLPCTTGAHWLLDPGYGITSATVMVDGQAWPMVPVADPTYNDMAVDSGPVLATSDVSIVFDGSWTYPDQLILTRCLDAPVQPEPPTPPAPAPPTLSHFTFTTTVTTRHPARVWVHWRTFCDGQRLNGAFYAHTPLTRNLPTPVAEAQACRAVVWAKNLTHPRGIPKVVVTVATT